MNKIRDVSNDEYEEAIKDDSIIKISRSVARKYKSLIDSSELNQIVNIAIWKALSCYNGKKKTSFISYVYKYVMWECKSHLRLKYKEDKTVEYTEKCVNYNTDFFDIIEDLCDTEANMIKQRFLQNMTYREIGEVNGFSREVARNKIDKILYKLKFKML